MYTNAAWFSYAIDCFVLLNKMFYDHFDNAAQQLHMGCSGVDVHVTYHQPL